MPGSQYNDAVESQVYVDGVGYVERSTNEEDRQKFDQARELRKQTNAMNTAGDAISKGPTTIGPDSPYYTDEMAAEQAKLQGEAQAREEALTNSRDYTDTLNTRADRAGARADRAEAFLKDGPANPNAPRDSRSTQGIYSPLGGQDAANLNTMAAEREARLAAKGQQVEDFYGKQEQTQAALGTSKNSEQDYAEYVANYEQNVGDGQQMSPDEYKVYRGKETQSDLRELQRQYQYYRKSDGAPMDQRQFCEAMAGQMSPETKAQIGRNYPGIDLSGTSKMPLTTGGESRNDMDALIAAGKEATQKALYGDPNATDPRDKAGTREQARLDRAAALQRLQNTDRAAMARAREYGIGNQFIPGVGIVANPQGAANYYNNLQNNKRENAMIDNAMQQGYGMSMGPNGVQLTPPEQVAPTVDPNALPKGAGGAELANLTATNLQSLQSLLNDGMSDDKTIPFAERLETAKRNMGPQVQVMVDQYNAQARMYGEPEITADTLINRLVMPEPEKQKGNRGADVSVGFSGGLGDNAWDSEQAKIDEQLQRDGSDNTGENRRRIGGTMGLSYQPPKAVNITRALDQLPGAEPAEVDLALAKGGYTFNANDILSMDLDAVGPKELQAMKDFFDTHGPSMPGWDQGKWDAKTAEANEKLTKPSTEIPPFYPPV